MLTGVPLVGTVITGVNSILRGSEVGNKLTRD